MRVRPSNKPLRRLIAGAMVLAFAVRALAPQGFMPSRDRPFSLEICPEGLPAAFLMLAGHHHHHGGPHSYTDHCVFGTACASGPPSQPALIADRAPTELALPAPLIATAIVVRLVYLPHVRGPPPTA